jgi:cobalt-zinc-cadmium efflux system protein
MVAVAGVSEFHDLHVWEVTCGFPALSGHVLVREDRDCHELAGDLERLLDNEFDIEHTTLEVDHEHTQLLSIDPAEQVQRSVRHAQRGSPSRR